jgi:uncharacterized membrane protein
MIIYLLALLLGVIAGLRAMTVPAAMSWAAHVGALNLASTRLAFVGNAWTPWVLSALAIGELITDQLPTTPSRKVPVQFGTRVVIGGCAGAVICMTAGSDVFGALAGAAGAVIGTLGGSSARHRLAAAFGRDRPAAFLEDAVAVLGAALLMAALP